MKTGFSATKRAAAIIIVVIVVVAALGVGAYYYSTPKPAQTAMTTAATTAAPVAPEKILIGADLPLTGGGAALGQQAENAIKIWEQNVNSQGGVFVKQYGKKIPVSVVTLDFESNAAKAAQDVENLANQGVLVIFGPAGTVWGFAAAPASERDKVPMVTIQTSGVQLTRRGYSWVFAGYKSFYQDIPTIFDMIHDQVPSGQIPKTYAVISDNTAFGKEGLQWFTYYAKQRGVTVVLKANVTGGQQDYTPTILSLKEANPDVMLDLMFNHPDVYNFQRQMKTLNYYPKLDIEWTAASTSDEWVGTLGKDGNYAVVTFISWSPSFQFAGSKEFVNLYQKTFGKVSPSDAGVDYAILQTIGQAIQDAGKLDRAAIRDALQNVNASTIMGPISFEKPGSTDPGRLVVQRYGMQYQNGTLVTVWPKQYANAKLIYPAPKPGGP